MTLNTDDQGYILILTTCTNERERERERERGIDRHTMLSISQELKVTAYVKIVLPSSWNMPGL